MKTSIAQSIKISGVDIKGPLEGPGGQPIEKLSDVLGIILNFLFPLAGVLLFIFLVSGGYTLLTSSGNPEKVKLGKSKVTSAIIGFILLVISFFAVKIISFILGIEGGFF